MKINNSYTIATTLKKEDVVKQIEKKTILKGKHQVNIKDYYFYNGKVNNDTFEFMPLAVRIPLYGRKNSFIPKVRGKIFESNGMTMIEVKAKLTWAYIVIFLIYNIFCLLMQFRLWQYLGLTATVVIILIAYLRFVLKCVANLLEDILNR